MGIKGLFSLIQKFAPEAVRVRGISQYRGCPVAIDTNIFLYSFVALLAALFCENSLSLAYFEIGLGRQVYEVSLANIAPSKRLHYRRHLYLQVYYIFVAATFTMTHTCFMCS